jgi:hypothetical protein
MSNIFDANSLLLQCNNCRYWSTPASAHYADRKRGLCQVTLPPYFKVPISVDRSTNWSDSCGLFRPNAKVDIVFGISKLAGV